MYSTNDTSASMKLASVAGPLKYNLAFCNDGTFSLFTGMFRIPVISTQSAEVTGRGLTMGT
jgi:hypothetical protein